jgi:uncharacterized membrane protein YqjE
MANQSTAMPEIERAVDALPSLFTRLGDQLTQLFDAKLSLLRIELKEDVATYLRGTMMIVGGAVIALIGFALLNVAMAFFVSMIFDGAQIPQAVRYALGFVITAVLYLVVGAALILKAKNRMAKQGVLPPKTVTELERDKDWLRKEI